MSVILQLSDAPVMRNGPAKVTPARRQALEVLARSPGRAAMDGQDTSDPGLAGHPETPTISWHARIWLVREGLVVPLVGQPEWYQLTLAGVVLAEKLGLSAIAREEVRGGVSAVRLRREDWDRVVTLLHDSAREHAASGLGQRDAAIADLIEAEVDCCSAQCRGAASATLAQPDCRWWE